MRSALETAGTIVLERVMLVSATFPTEFLGEVLNDLKPRRGRVAATNQSGEGSVTVTAYVPEAGLHRYGLDLRSITSGQSRLDITFHHLGEAP
jgi:translation elongation factor EF-G